MNLIYFFNRPAFQGIDNHSGTWLKPFATAISKYSKKNILIFSVCKSSKVPTCKRYDAVIEVLVPETMLLNRNRLDNFRRILASQSVEISTSIFHIWGTESKWLEIVQDIGVPNDNIVLELQGLLSATAELYSFQIDKGKFLSSIKDFVRWRNMDFSKNLYRKKGQEEVKRIGGIKFLNAPSPWAADIAQIWNNNIVSNITDLPLREEFYNFDPNIISRNRNTVKTLVFSSSGMVPYKGLHQAFRLLKIVIRAGFRVRLKVVGVDQPRFFWGSSYELYLARLLSKLKLSQYVEFCGRLSAENIIKLLSEADIFLVTSNVESYCVAMAEAQFIGLPVVAAYNGGTSELGSGGAALFYNVNDAFHGASLVIKLLKDPEYMNQVGSIARSAALKRHNIEKIANRHLEIYEMIEKMSS